MTKEELFLLRRVLNTEYALLSDWITAKEKAIKIIEREIHLKTINPQTGRPLND